MTSRPYLSLGIVDLEKRFDQERDDADFLNRLLHELDHRTTQRAKKLRARAVQAQGVAPKQKQERKETSPPSARETATPNVSPRHRTPKPEALAPEPVINTAPMPTFTRAETDIEGLSEPERVLSSWIALEVLSPQSFRKPEDLVAGDKYRIANISRGALPWENGGERSRKNYRMYYQIVLGTVQMPPSIEGLLKVYTDTRNERPQARGESVIATVIVDKDGKPSCALDKDGRPILDTMVNISSFAWGLPIAMAGDLKSLGNWSQIEGQLHSALASRLWRVDDEGEPIPLSSIDISTAYEWLIKELNLSQALCDKPAIALRTYQYFKNEGPPETLLLNSFYLDDLSKAKTMFADGDAPENLRRYLADIVPEERFELLRDEEALSRALHPSKMPLGSWPAQGRHSLVTLQQAAVNLTSNDLKSGGILAVNGPPGTGKTTLLRDVVANVVTERARIMATYHDPEDAFTNSKERLKRGNAFLWMYKLDEKLRGFEMVVASSNNKAVENVSAELPSIDSVAKDSFQNGYFKTISDGLLERETWGMIAAVLGNSSNRWKFSQKFWWDEDTGLSNYLRHASGSKPMVTITDEKGDEQKRPPVIVVKENPPSEKSEANRRWLKAKRKFKEIEVQTELLLKKVSYVADLPKSLLAAENELNLLSQNLESETNKLKSLQSALQENRNHLERAQKDIAEVSVKIEEQNRSKPNILSRIFSSKKYGQWQSEFTQCNQILERHKGRMHALGAENGELSKSVSHCELHLASSKSALHGKTSEIRKLNTELAEFKANYSGQFIDEEFFKLEYEKRQLAAPWLDKIAAKARQDMFEVSMELHRAFIDAAAKPLRHNIGLILDSYGTRSFGTPERDALIPYMWSSLFLVVPVISTTFASVSRMFSGIGKDALGWLLIDEAGQALPQAAVGAIMRCSRAVVVGDPMQIEPVVMLPDHLTDAICREFKIDETVYNAPAGSAQTLADSATDHYASFETKLGSRDVGVPLLVHRRCENPMFGVSNDVAYENLMVQAKAARHSPIKSALGDSRWIDVSGAGQDKWCAAEGKVVLQLLRDLKKSGADPDLYVVTPFVIVQDRLRDLIRKSGLLDGWVETPNRWPYERIGTVHTVQGREAEAVIFVLGAPDASQTGARNWAGGRPNLLNVAVSRAKECIYVVGNKSLWSKAGVFERLTKL
jgi:hypothetical protein